VIALRLHMPFVTLQVLEMELALARRCRLYRQLPRLPLVAPVTIEAPPTREILGHKQL
jgi:hypothetical protein